MTATRTPTSALNANRVKPIEIEEDRSADLKQAIDEIVKMSGVTIAAQQTRLRSEIARLLKKVWHCKNPTVVAERTEHAERSRLATKRALLARSDLEKAAAELKRAFAELDKIWGKLDRILGIEGYSPSPSKRDSRGPRYVPERTYDELLNDIDLEFPERWTDELLNAILHWAKRNPPLVSTEPRRGRPKTADLYFFYLVCLLSSAVSDAGGRLTLNKNYPEKASLPRALQLLRPHLPQGFNSTNPSVRELFKARQGAEQPLVLRLAHLRLSGW
jgi:hypothetical protein